MKAEPGAWERGGSYEGLPGEGGVLAIRRSASPRDHGMTAGLTMVKENPIGVGSAGPRGELALLTKGSESLPI